MSIKKKILTLILLLCVFFPCLTMVEGCKSTSEPVKPEWKYGVYTDGRCQIGSPEAFIAFVNGINKIINTINGIERKIFTSEPVKKWTILFAQI